ncbi:hypothetical protein L3X38_016402 [Prunus dulcis]|uniref:Uncharacterized protein n=1 Tax=Prunus dulcis TaxID=3755 RepID=A0AAD4Z9S7_PRUDU|nr:hypothetical protein L3X38_016402 [Prunus dulcis]
MIGSIDCMHWQWKNCPIAWQRDYGNRKGQKSIILEAVAGFDTGVWHAFFGVAGSQNDLNVLGQSPVFNDVLRGEAPNITYEINNTVYQNEYYLADGIYSRWTTFVKTIPHPRSHKQNFFAHYQEGYRKDVERCFGILQAPWVIIRGATRLFDEECANGKKNFERWRANASLASAMTSPPSGACSGPTRPRANPVSWPPPLARAASRCWKLIFFPNPPSQPDSAGLALSTCDELDKINRNFLWGSNGDNSRTHLVNWDSVCMSKKKGGLGLKHTALMNQSMLAKVGWRLWKQKDNLWSDALIKTYLQGNSSSIIRNERPMSSSPSPTWRAIEHGVDVLKNGVKIRVGDELHTFFWTDYWFGDGPLIQSVEGVDEDKLQLKVAYYLAHGTWDLQKLKENLPLEMVAHIICVPGYAVNLTHLFRNIHLMVLLVSNLLTGLTGGTLPV